MPTPGFGDWGHAVPVCKEQLVEDLRNDCTLPLRSRIRVDVLLPFADVEIILDENVSQRLEGTSHFVVLKLQPVLRCRKFLLVDGGRDPNEVAVHFSPGDTTYCGRGAW